MTDAELYQKSRYGYSAAPCGHVEIHCLVTDHCYQKGGCDYDAEECRPAA